MHWPKQRAYMQRGSKLRRCNMCMHRSVLMGWCCSWAVLVLLIAVHVRPAHGASHWDDICDTERFNATANTTDCGVHGGYASWATYSPIARDFMDNGAFRICVTSHAGGFAVLAVLLPVQVRYHALACYPGLSSSKRHAASTEKCGLDLTKLARVSGCAVVAAQRDQHTRQDRPVLHHVGQMLLFVRGNRQYKW